MKKTVLGGILALSLALGACGGGGTTTPQPDTDTQPPVTDTPAPALPADAPQDATASREFELTAQQARAAVQGLGLTEQADLGERLRVVLSVSRSRTGTNAGKKRASAVFIWGSSAKLAGTYALTLTDAGQTAPLKSSEGKLELAASGVDFQDKATKNTAYHVNTGLQCARLTIASASGEANYSTAAPLEVCESTTDQDAEQKFLLSKLPTTYTYLSDGSDQWKFKRLSSLPAPALPTNAEVAAAFGLPTFTAVSRVSGDDFFRDLNTYYVQTNPAAATDKMRQQYGAFPKHMRDTFEEWAVYRVQATETREIIYVAGRNGYGVSGVWATRFHSGAGNAPNPAYATASTSGKLTVEGSGVSAVVEVGPVAPQASTVARSNLRRADTCAPGSGPYTATMQQASSTPQADGRVSLKFSSPATVAPGSGTFAVLDYQITVTYNGASKVYTGSACVAAPSGDPKTLSESTVNLTFGYKMVGGQRVEVAQAKVLVPKGAQVSGTYFLFEQPQCGAATMTMLKPPTPWPTKTAVYKPYSDEWTLTANPNGEQLGNGNATNALIYDLNIRTPDGQTVHNTSGFACYQPL